MSKKTILVILLLMLLSFGGITLYNTFAYNEEAHKLDDSQSDYNLIYTLKEHSNQHISVSANEEKYIDIELNNTYSSAVKYGMYYYLVSPNNMPNDVNITLSEDSTNPVEDVLKPAETRVVSIKITNSSEYTLDLVIGALIGFENGDINDLVKNGEVLIK